MTTVVRTTASHPEGNDIKSSHRVVNNALMVGLRINKCIVEDLLREIVTAYNATPHSSIGCSPYYAMFGEPILAGWQFGTQH